MVHTHFYIEEAFITDADQMIGVTYDYFARRFRFLCCSGTGFPNA